MGDAGGSYHFELGMFGEKTNHVESTYKNARNERQRIRINSTRVPMIQVREEYGEEGYKQ